MSPVSSYEGVGSMLMGAFVGRELGHVTLPVPNVLVRTCPSLCSSSCCSNVEIISKMKMKIIKN